MPPETRPEADERREPDTRETPAVSICESRPGRTLFIEAGNTDGWIASDLTIEPEP